MSLDDFICWLALATTVGAAAGFIAGRRVGRSEERLWSAVRRARKPRRIAVTIDYDFAASAFRNSGFKVTREAPERHDGAVH